MSLLNNRRDPLDAIVSDIIEYRPVQDQLALAEEIAVDEIKAQWSKISALLESKARQRWEPMPPKRRRVTGIEPWLDEVWLRRRLSKEPALDIPEFYVSEEPPYRYQLHPVLYLWIASPIDPAKGRRIATLHREQLNFVGRMK